MELIHFSLFDMVKIMLNVTIMEFQNGDNKKLQNYIIL